MDKTKALLKRELLLILLFATFYQSVSSQNALEKFIVRSDSLIEIEDSLRLFYSGLYNDTIVNGMKLKKVSNWSPVPFAGSNFYYGKIEIRNGKVVGDQPPARFTYDDCNPCYFYDYRTDGTLWDEGVFLADCIYGPGIRYFRNGKVARTRSHIPDPEYKSGHCSVAHGEAATYNRNGDKIISEFWENGKLTKITPYNSKSTGDVKFIVGGRVLLINDTLNLTDLPNVNLQPDSNANPALKDGYYVTMNIQQRKRYKEFFGLQNLKSFSDSVFIASLKEKNINMNLPLNMNVDIYETKGNEIIESHYLVFDKTRH